MPDSPSRFNIRTIEQLLHSQWGRLAQDPKIRQEIPALLRRLLERVPSSHPVVNRIRLALNLFEKESAGGLLNSRNLIILSAALLYTLWPADTIPDILPVIGWLDDAGILALVLSTLASRFRKDAPSPEDNPDAPPSDTADEAQDADSGPSASSRNK